MIPGLLRTLFWLVLAWTVFRFLDRLFGGARKAGRHRAQQNREGQSRRTNSASGNKAAKDDHLGEYVDYEEVD